MKKKRSKYLKKKNQIKAKGETRPDNAPPQDNANCPVDKALAKRILDEYRVWFKSLNIVQRKFADAKSVKEYIEQLPSSCMELKVRELCALFQWFIDEGYLK